MIIRWMHDKFGVDPATEVVIGGAPLRLMHGVAIAPEKKNATPLRMRRFRKVGFGGGLLGLLLLDILHDIAHLLELLGILVGDFHAELFLEGHD